MLAVYRLVTCFYFLVLHLAACFGGKARKWVTGRRGWRDRISRLEHCGKIVWIHCASLGEHEQALPLIEALKQADPSVRIVLTFFSPTGYENRLHDPLAHAVYYLPPDGPRNARDFVTRLRPDLVIFVKYEFWYYTLEAVSRSHVPLILVSAHFRSEQFTGLRGQFFRRILPFFDQVFVQDEASRKLLAGRLAFERATVAGDTRYDRVWKQAQRTHNLPPALQALSSIKPLIVCGSTWPADERFLVQVRHRVHCAIKYPKPSWLIVPHEPGPEAERRLQELFDSDLRLLDPDSSVVDLEPGLVYAVNQVGWLSRLYTLADACWIGGGFGTGIHNVLEAAVYGKCVCFGPNYLKFLEAVELVDASLAWSFEDAHAAADRLAQLLVNPGLQEQLAKKATQFVEQRCGATQEILRWLELHSIIESEPIA